MLGWIRANPLVAVALFFALVAVVIGVLTVAISVIRFRQDRRRSAIRTQIRSELVDRVFASDPEWEQWVQQASPAERREIRFLLDTYLRRFRGAERETLCALAEELDIPRTARETLKRAHDTSRSLTWLAALGVSVDYSVLQDHCTGTPHERAAAARVLHESDVEEAGRLGTELLLGDGTEPLSVFGLDTLYQLNRGGDTPVLPVATAHADEWGLRLRIQVLTVLRFCQAAAPDESFRWVLSLLDHESPRMRVAATLVMEQHGWRSALRDSIDMDQQLRDPHSAVRQATYYALAAWGDDESARWLEWALFTERTQEGRLTVVRALQEHPQVESLPTNPFMKPYTEWVTAETRAGRHYHRAVGGSLWS